MTSTSKPSKPVLLIEALATDNDSGLGKLTRYYLSHLQDLRQIYSLKILTRVKLEFLHPSECQIIRPFPYRVWLELGFPWQILIHRPQKVLCLGLSLPRIRFLTPFISVIPDVGPLENLPFPTSSRDADNRKRLARVLSASHGIICPGNFTRSRILKLSSVTVSKINCIPPFFPPERLPPSSNPTRAGSGPYFLAVGNMEPRKNLPRLLRAYKNLLQNYPECPELVIAGRFAWGSREVLRLQKQLQLESKVKILGRLAKADLMHTVSECTLFISASLYEGWGFPLYEALCLGRVSIYHKGSSHEDFAQGFALATDCSDVTELTKALILAWQDRALRTQLQKKLCLNFPPEKGESTGRLLLKALG